MYHAKQAPPHRMATSQLTPKQNLKIKSPIVNINYQLNQVLSAFDNMNKELSPGFCLIDTFSDCFSFNIGKCKETEVRTAHLRKLNDIYKLSKNDPNILFVITDVSIKDDIATSVMHSHRKHAIISKTVHHTINVTSTKAELFTIRCSIS